MEQKMPNQVGWGERVSYAMSDFGCNTIFQIVGTYFLVFCTDTLGVAAAAVTGLFAITAIIDSIDGVSLLVVVRNSICHLLCDGLYGAATIRNW